MSTRDIEMIAIGGVLGGAIVGAALYFGVIKRYIPLRELESELDDLRYQIARAEKIKNDIVESTSVQEPVVTERPGDSPSLAIKGFNEALDQDEAAVAEAAQSEPEIEDEPMEEDDEYDENEIYDPLRFDPELKRYVIDGRGERFDGPLNDDEMNEYQLALEEGLQLLDHGEKLIDSVLMNIYEARFEKTIDEDEPSYLISLDEHNDGYVFLDTESLDYYEEDDILANGREIIGQIDKVINPIVLNHFDEPKISGDPNVVWCRNDIHRTDYEIVRHTGSYQEEVLGVPTASVYKPPRKFNKEIAADMEENYERHSRHRE